MYGWLLLFIIIIIVIVFIYYRYGKSLTIWYPGKLLNPKEYGIK